MDRILNGTILDRFDEGLVLGNTVRAVIVKLGLKDGDTLGPDNGMKY